MTITGSSTYTDPTASMQVDPEAPHQSEAASESCPGSFPIQDARCATYPGHMEWVPDRERPIVPDVMAALCRRCPARQQCLLWAMAGKERGYWAGSTTADRQRLASLEQTSVETADWLQELARREATAGALHAAGEGSYFWYRRRNCRCLECKQANAATRAHEREVARQKAGVAA